MPRPRRPRSDPPAFIAPQLTKLATVPPKGAHWVHELKLDGYRLHARIAHGAVTLLTRTGLDWTARYPAIAAALGKLKVASAYIDGEICALRPDGTTSFALLQAATDHQESAQLLYFAFDLLFLEGEDVTQLTLGERKALLAELLRRAPKALRYVDHVTGDGAAFYEAACGHRAEGIVSKQLGAPYKPKERGTWLKIRCVNEEEFVIVGYTNPQGGRQHLGALLLGYYTAAGRLLYAGRAGTGMDEAELARLVKKLRPLETRTMPIDAPPPRQNRFGSPLKLSEVHWVEPKLVAQVRYLTWTADKLLRQVVYLGLREDKPARQVVREAPG